MKEQNQLQPSEPRHERLLHFDLLLLPVNDGSDEQILVTPVGAYRWMLGLQVDAGVVEGLKQQELDEYHEVKTLGADFIQQRRQDESPSGSRRASSASEGQHPAVREKLVEQRCPGKNPSAKLPSVTLPPAFVRPRGAAFSQEVVETNSWLRPDELNASGAQLLQDVVRADWPAGVVAQK
ncbi:unnamed protein product [Pleuronectes platessa]|uniref:Uncharacterized protein n=1 Tax=Pleuronectes platessa TaxID=8262 RepID=A0A9N7UWX3_PLEPL|nr:unnamed protein product [Pleuronectes platessa]